MATDQSIKWHPLPPPHADVVLAITRQTDRIMAEYRGTPEALVAAGCATAEMMERGRPGVARRDSFGQRVLKYPSGKRQVRLIRYAETVEQARALPGAIEATGGLAAVLALFAGQLAAADKCRFTIEAAAEALEAALAALWAIDPDDDDVDPAKIPCPPRLFPVLEVAHSCLFPTQQGTASPFRDVPLPLAIRLMQRCLLANLAHLSLECESESLTVYQEAVACLLSDPARAAQLLAGDAAAGTTPPEALRRFHAKRLPAALWDGARLTL
jgi:hypothetical protein